jgi:hypothetical protein
MKTSLEGPHLIFWCTMIDISDQNGEAWLYQRPRRR